MLYTRNKPHKRKPNWRNILLTALCLALVGVSIGLLCRALPSMLDRVKPADTELSAETPNLSTPVPGTEAPQSESPTPTPDATPAAAEESPSQTPAETPRATGTQSVTFGVVGDIIMHDMELQAAKNGTKYDFSTFFTRITPYLTWQDFVIGNLETTVGTKNFDATTAPASFLTALKDSGFDALMLANEHILDKDIVGAQATVSAVKDAGMSSAGAYASGAEYIQPLILTKDNLRIAVLNYTEMTEKNPDGAADTVKYLTKENFQSDLNQLKSDPAGVDFILVCVHWGTEDDKTLTDSQKEWMQTFADSDVDVVLGAHPHFMQGLSYVQGSDGHKTLVACSLGNFLSSQRKDGKDAGVILNFTLTKDFDADTTTISDVQYAPTWVLKFSAGGKYSYEILSAVEYADKKYQNMSLADRDRIKLVQAEVEKALGTTAGKTDTTIRKAE